MTKVLRAIRHGWAMTTLAVVAGVGSLYGQQALLYVPAESSNQLWEYAVVSATGNATSLSTQSVTGNQPNVVAVSPNNRFMYVGSGTGQIIAYVVSFDGTLAPVGPPFVNAGSVRGLAAESTGKFLYAANNSGDRIATFNIDQTTGQLTGPTFELSIAGSGPRGLVADTSGHLYAALSGTGQVGAFRIEANGSLTSLGNVAAGSSPDRVAVANTGGGSFVYATNFFSDSISVYTVQGSGGLAINTTVSTPSGGRPLGVITDNTSKFLIVTLNSSTVANNVLVYSINGAGGLLLVGATPSQVSIASQPSGVTIDPSNRYLYVSNQTTASVSKFNFDATTGALSAPGNFATGGTPQFLLSRPAPFQPSSSVPAASTWSLLGLGFLLAGSSALLYRRAYR